MGKCRKCGVYVPGDFVYCYAHYEEFKEKKFAKYGQRKCQKCGTTLSSDRPLCWPCYQKHVLKK